MSAEIPDIAPTVIMSKDLGNYIDTFDVDMAAITDYLVGRGLSEDEIEKLTIEFTNELPRMNGMSKNGEFKDDYISVHYIDTLKHVQETGHASLFQTELNRKMNETLTYEFEHKILENDSDVQKANRRHAFKTPKTYFVAGTGLFGGAVLTSSVAPVSEVLARPDLAGIHPLQVLGSFALSGVAVGIAQVTGFLDDEHRRQYYSRPEEMLARKAAEEYQNHFVELSVRRA